MSVLEWFTEPGKAFRSIMLLSILLLPFAVALLNMPSTSALAINSARDCNVNSVVNCGALTTDELKTKCMNSSSVKAIFTDFGITGCDLTTMGNVVSGQVTSSGQVFANGKLVATDAMTAGRGDMAGSQSVTRNGVTFFKRPPSVSFVSSPLAAFVVMNNSQFRFAVLASCGNPVSATPVAAKTVATKKTPPPKVVTKVVAVPVPTPAPSQQQSQSQSQTVTVNAPAAAATASPQSPAAATATTSTPQTQAQSQASTVTATPAPVVSPTAAPTQLPNTGTGDVIGLGALVALTSSFVHYMFKRRKYNY